MNRRRTALTTLLALGLASLPATGQDSQSASKAKKPPTFIIEDENEGKAIKGVEVAPDPKQVAEIKEYPVNFQGPTAKGVTVFVTKVILFSDNRVRWFFSFWNRSKEGQTLYFDFEESFLADSQSNPYPQMGRQVISGNRGSIFMTTITSDRRLNTWIDFKAPEQPTTKFKVGIMLEGRYDHRADAFKPFLVELTEPLPPLPKKPKAVKENQEEALLTLAPQHDAGEPLGGMTSALAPPVELERSVKPTLAATETVRACGAEGRKYVGNIRGANGHAGSGGIQFEQRTDSRLLAATLYRNAQPLRDIWLIGDFHPQRSAPGGLVIRFEDFKKVTYTFTIDKNIMSGKDSEGNTYTFLYVKE